MAHIVSLYSGSSGNATAVIDAGRVYLVDMGGSCRKTLKALYIAGLSASSIAGIFVTHEHSDHISGLQVFLKNYPVPVFASSETARYLTDRLLADPSLITHIDSPIDFGGTTVTPFDTPHDSLRCFGYRFDFDGGKSAAVATDIGHMTDEVFSMLNGCSLVALESNYDEQMLRRGSYPYPLKQRILSDYGHLSNLVCAKTASLLAQNGTSRIMLMHISRENNTPFLAETCCLSALECCEAPDCAVYPAPRYDCGEVFEV